MGACGRHRVVGSNAVHASGVRIWTPVVGPLTPRAVGVGVLVCVLLALGGVTGVAAAQTSPAASLVEVRHDPSGRVIAAVTASAPALLAPTSVTVLVDGLPRAARVTPLAGRPNTASIEVSVPPLPMGRHEITIRLAQPGAPLLIGGGFEVENAGMLRLVVTPGSERTAPIDLRAESTVALGALDLRYFVDGLGVEAMGPGRAQIDPWRRTPGAKDVEVQALSDGRLVASARAMVTVPALDPVLEVEQSTVPGGVVLTVRANAQTPEGPSVVVRDGQRVLLRTQELVSRVVADSYRTVTVELRGNDSLVRAQEVKTGAPGASNAAPVSPWLLGVLAAGLATVALVMAGRRSRFRNAAVLAALAPVTGSAPASTAPAVPLWPVALGELPRVIIRGPNGVVRRVPVPTDSVVTIGSSGSCDIQLDDPSLRPVHGRLTPFAEGHFVLQAVGVDEDGLGAGARGPHVLVVRPHEEVQVGRYVLVIE